MRKTTTAFVGLSAALAVALTGCSSKASDDGGGGNSGGGDSGSVKTDVGVTDDTITLGALTDTSGPFKSGGLAAVYGAQIWAEDVNDNGGLCGRQIEIDVKDHGYKADNAVPLYQQMKDNDLALIQLLGSPMLAALKSNLKSDEMLAAVPSMASNNLDAGIIISTTATYDIEMLNGMHYLQQEGMLNDGDKFAAIYLDNEAGQNGLAGVKAYAAEHNIEVIESPISATDTDLTATVTKMKSEGVNVMSAMTSPAQISSIAVAMKAQGFDVPLLGWGPTYAPTLIADQTTVDALKDNTYISASVAPFTHDSETAKKIQEEYAAMGVADPASSTIFIGYMSGLAFEAIIEKACDDGDLTRAGLLAARDTVDSVETDGLSGTLDFTDPGAPTTRETYIVKIDASLEGGTTAVSDLIESEEAQNYKAPFQT